MFRVVFQEHREFSMRSLARASSPISAAFPEFERQLVAGIADGALSNYSSPLCFGFDPRFGSVSIMNADRALVLLMGAF